jgi:ABC-2 type transport system permease protein
VVTDLLRPVNLVWQLLAADLGRMGYAMLTNFAAPIVLGLVLFDFYLPQHWPAYPAFLVSVVAANLICFGCQHLVYATVYWLMDVRGPRMVWGLLCGVLSGLLFPLWFLPHRLAVLLIYGTPFPSILQTSTDILTERRPALPALAGQLAWLVVVLAAAQWVQRRANRRLVIQGG